MFASSRYSRRSKAKTLDTPILPSYNPHSGEGYEAADTYSERHALARLRTAAGHQGNDHVEIKKLVYLDSTIPSYLFDERDSIKNYIEVTKRWWAEERQNFRVVISGETVAETNRGEHPYKEKIIECVSQLEILPYNQQLEEIVRVYSDNHLMPQGSTGDGLHLAYASFHKVDFLLTWNCNHLANANKRQHIRIINTRLNLFIPEIITPLELFTETNP